jgi:hypothetical protein
LRRTLGVRFVPLAIMLVLAVCVSPAQTQQGPIDPRIPPPPPPPETIPASPETSPVPASPPRSPEPVRPPAPRLTAPETVVIPAGTQFAVTLDTPLSTRISKTGQLVNFRTSEALPVVDNLVIPPDTIFVGKVTEAHRPGAFGKSGVLKVKVDRLELTTGAGTDVIARLDSQDINAQGRLRSDSNRAANLVSLGLWAAQGAIIGAQIKGAKGAGVGAGAAAAVALIIMMSKHGADVYLEPGTPFLVELDQPASLPGKAVLAAQANALAANTGGASQASIAPAKAETQANSASANGAATAASDPSTDPATDPDRPKLKHRPKPQQP